MNPNHKINNLDCRPHNKPISCNQKIYYIGPTGPTGPTGPSGGPTGPTGPSGESVEITVRSTKTAEAGEEAQVIDTITSNHHLLDFIIPKGDIGPTGLEGPQGIQGEKGEKGDAGSSVNVLGKYDTYDELIAAHPQGNINDSYLVNGDLYVWSNNDKTWTDVGRIQGPTGPQGIQGEQGIPGIAGPEGPQGPTGPTLLRSAYFVTFNDGTKEDGIPIAPGERLPISRTEIDVSNLAQLDTTNKTIKFNEIGYYNITFTVSTYKKQESTDFNPTKDLVALGFRLINTDNVYIGTSEFIYNEEVKQLLAQGIIAVENTDNLYELVNLSKQEIYLNSPDIKNLGTHSYFANSLVTITVEYLGRLGA